MGITTAKIGFAEGALEYFTKGVERARKTGSKFRLVKAVINNLVHRAEMGLDAHEETLTLLHEVELMATELSDPRGLAEIYLKYSFKLLERGEATQALVYVDKCLPLARQLNIAPITCNSYRYLCRACLLFVF